MYAAAGGASLASRQARQRQRQNKKLQQLKSSQTKEPKTPQAKQFHNYTDDAIVPRLSRVERGTLLRPPHLTTTDRRHSTSQCQLKEPPRSRMRESPSISIPVHRDLELPRAQSPLSVLPSVPMPPDDGRMERRCSFVRQVEQTGEEGGLLDKCNHLCNYEIKENVWETTFPELERDVFGSIDYPFSECSQGRAAWQERGRRCSLSEEARQHRIKQTEAHHRWMKRNRIHDSTYGTSDEDDFFSVYHQSAAANALLYVGLGTTAIGSVIFFVGTGEKGFKTLELRLIGPTLIACGILCCLIRVLLCACPSTCLRRKKTRIKDTCPHAPPRYSRPRDPPPLSSSHHIDNIALLSNTRKQVSIVPPSNPLPSTSNHNPTSLPPPSLLELPKINLPSSAAGSSPEETAIELQQFTYDLCDVSSNESEDERSTRVETGHLKHTRVREPANNQDLLTVVIEKISEDIENKISEHVNNEEEIKTKHSGIVLSPLQLGQQQSSVLIKSDKSTNRMDK